MNCRKITKVTKYCVKEKTGEESVSFVLFECETVEASETEQPLEATVPIVKVMVERLECQTFDH